MISDKWRLQLAAEQLDNGSWGRFHTTDTKLKQRRRFPTTETALARARDLELTKDDEIVKKAISVMERYLSGEEKWTDAHEKHYGFDIAFNTFIAANINLFDTSNPSADFAKRDNKIILNPYAVHIMWLFPGNQYIDENDERVYFDYIWHRPEGVYYRFNSECAKPVCAGSKLFDYWLAVLEDFKCLPSFNNRGLCEIREHLETQIYRLQNEKISLPANTLRTGRYTDLRKNSRMADLIYRIKRILTA